MKNYFERFKNVGTVLAVVAAVAQLIVLLGADVDINYIQAVAVAICNVLVLVGIMNNPETPGIDTPNK